MLERYRCPRGCEHPQPFWLGDILFCGLCWWFRGLHTELVMCDCGE
jgi:hypothetical protein